MMGLEIHDQVAYTAGVAFVVVALWTPTAMEVFTLFVVMPIEALAFPLAGSVSVPGWMVRVVVLWLGIFAAFISTVDPEVFDE